VDRGVRRRTAPLPDGLSHLQERSTAVTKYQVTPERGRVGKARQVQPFELEVNSLPHDLGKIEKALTVATHRYLRRYDTKTNVNVTDVSAVFQAEIICDGSVVARLLVEQIES
jgi:hypothetical protein